LDDLKERSGYSHLKEEALDRTMWRAWFGRDFGPVMRQTAEWMNVNREWAYIWLSSHEVCSDLCSCSTSLPTRRELQPVLRRSLHGLVHTWRLYQTAEYWGRNWTSPQLEFLQHKIMFSLVSGNCILMKDWYKVFFVLILCTIDHIVINQPNALNYILRYFSFTMAPTCFSKTLPSSGSLMWGPHYAADGQSGLRMWRHVILTCLLPYWRWSGSERNTVAPWWWHCFAETCRSHRKRKIKKYIIQVI
jgi:hypothetical protein